MIIYLGESHPWQPGCNGNDNNIQWPFPTVVVSSLSIKALSAAASKKCIAVLQTRFYICTSLLMCHHNNILYGLRL